MKHYLSLLIVFTLLIIAVMCYYVHLIDRLHIAISIDSYPKYSAKELEAAGDLVTKNKYAMLLVNDIGFPIDSSRVVESQVVAPSNAIKLSLNNGVVMLVNKPTKNGLSIEDLKKLARSYKVTANDFSFFMRTAEFKQLLSDLHFKEAMCAKDAMHYTVIDNPEWYGLIVYRERMAEFTWASHDKKWHGVVFINTPQTTGQPEFHNIATSLVNSMDISGISDPQQ